MSKLSNEDYCVVVLLVVTGTLTVLYGWLS